MHFLNTQMVARLPAVAVLVSAGSPIISSAAAIVNSPRLVSVKLPLASPGKAARERRITMGLIGSAHCHYLGLCEMCLAGGRIR